MFRSHPLRSSIGAAFAVLACLATDVRAGVASMVTPNPSYAGNPLRFTKFLPGGACYDEARILELSTSGTTITVRYAVDSIPPMICGVSPPLGLEIDIGPREPGLREIFGTVAHDQRYRPVVGIAGGVRGRLGHRDRRPGARGRATGVLRDVVHLRSRPAAVVAVDDR